MKSAWRGSIRIVPVFKIQQDLGVDDMTVGIQLMVDDRAAPAADNDLFGMGARGVAVQPVEIGGTVS